MQLKIIKLCPKAAAFWGGAWTFPSISKQVDFNHDFMLELTGGLTISYSDLIGM